MKNSAWTTPFLLLALLSINGCGKDSNAVLARDITGPAAPDHGLDQHPGTPPVTPAQPAQESATQLFAAQYKYVNLVCAAFSADSQTLAGDAQPTANFAQQVYPALDNTVNQAIQSPSGRLRAGFSIATSLNTATIGSGAASSQAPVVVATASATVQFNGAAQATETFPAATLWVSLPAVDSQIASASLSDAAAGAGTPIFGSLVIRCHLEGKALGR